MKEGWLFRVVDKFGKGVAFDGLITDQENDTILRFQPARFWDPVVYDIYAGQREKRNTGAAGKKLAAAMWFALDLPEAVKEGYSMTVTDSSADQLWVTVKSNIRTNNPFIYLFGHTRQQVKIAELHALENGSAVFKIDKNLLGEGISHLTVFNALRQPVCERLVFKKPQSLLIDLQNDATDYALRNKVSLSVHAQSADNKPQIADLSLSVFLADSLQAAAPEDILSYLWLESRAEQLH